MNTQDSEKKLQEQLAQLPKEMAPERDLWSGIEKAIQSKSQTNTSVNTNKPAIPMAWAATIIAAVLLTWGVIKPQQEQLHTPISLVSAMQQDFEQQKQTMLVSFGQPKISALPLEMQKQLAELLSARQAIEKALVDDPNSSDLLNILRWTQKQELELIKQLYSPQWQTI
jgi:anti-sigma-K factor RskA